MVTAHSWEEVICQRPFVGGANLLEKHISKNQFKGGVYQQSPYLWEGLTRHFPHL